MSESGPMLRVASNRAPARWPALLFLSLALLLQGCGLLAKKDGEPASAEASPVTAVDGGRKDARDAFSLEVRSPDDAVREYLQLHLDLQRYRKLDDLAASEVSRLMVAAEANARELLNTLGYFTPTLTLELHETPDSDKAPRQITLNVEPGPATRVSAVQIHFNGPVASDARDKAHRDAIRAAWRLPPGQIFTQEGWDAAKS